MIEACNSQPYSHIHRPGIAVGGHCIPVYPRLYLWNDPDATVVRAAREANAGMPEYAVGLLEGAHGDLAGARVAVLGAAYRGGVKETAFSGVFPAVEALQARGAQVVRARPAVHRRGARRAGLHALPPGRAGGRRVVQADHAGLRGDHGRPTCRAWQAGRRPPRHRPGRLAGRDSPRDRRAVTADEHDLRPQVLELAAELGTARWTMQPFYATLMGMPGHDADVPDLSAVTEEQYRRLLRGLVARAEALQSRALQERALDDAAEAAPAVDPATLVTLTTVVHTAVGMLAELEARLVEFVVGPMADGPGTLFQLASVTAPADAAAADDYVTRCTRLGQYLDACAQRLREGAEAGRTPVRALVDRTLSMVDGYLATPVEQDPLLAVPAPAGSDERAWRGRIEDAVRDRVRPATVRYRDLLAELLPASRDDDRPGLVHLPGGREIYDRLVLVHTTLPLGAEQVHELGLGAVADLREQLAGVGGRLGFDGFDPLREAAARSSEGVSAERALAAAREAVARAEAALPGWFAEPLPPPCRVEPMSTHLGKAGTPPHYSPPTPDGRRPGTYWFNVDEIGAGAGWELEATAYHEAVPGHHLQLERMLTRSGLPQLQRLGIVTAHAEGWGLYAELLAGEMGLYPDDRALAGALGGRIFRAARLVVDTGLHALGWSRSQALDYMAANVPLGAGEAASEVDRYIAWPGQALAYYTGFTEILRLREEARDELGDSFDLAGFHAAVLDNGAVPLPALRTAVAAWVAETAAGASTR